MKLEELKRLKKIRDDARAAADDAADAYNTARAAVRAAARAAVRAAYFKAKKEYEEQDG